MVRARDLGRERAGVVQERNVCYKEVRGKGYETAMGGPERLAFMEVALESRCMKFRGVGFLNG